MMSFLDDTSEPRSSRSVGVETDQPNNQEENDVQTYTNTDKLIIFNI